MLPCRGRLPGTPLLLGGLTSWPSSTCGIRKWDPCIPRSSEAAEAGEKLWNLKVRAWPPPCPQPRIHQASCRLPVFAHEVRSARAILTVPCIWVMPILPLNPHRGPRLLSVSTARSRVLNCCIAVTRVSAHRSVSLLRSGTASWTFSRTSSD